ncbi:MAG: hypothetical protein RMJ56_08140 [Gemmataceae bacterium]|nr:hypothetical protein [Gemmata sp.]MDW8197560.1 hypothetical protein [Gemmataceae bacterium]
MMRPLLRWLVMNCGWLVAVGLCSCGSNPETPIAPSYNSDDAKAIAVLIEDFNEYKANPKRAGELFAQPAKDWRKYDTYNFDLSGSPTVNGDKATATVKVRTDEGTDQGTVEWSFVKVGNKWKIQAAPLP